MVRQAPLLPSSLTKYRADIDYELRSIVNGSSLLLYEMVRYHFGWSDRDNADSSRPIGKAIRPALCLLVCEATGGDYHKALPAAAAIELVHNYSLIHDDIQDGDRERHHRPTVWSIWGKPQAINAGSALRSLASLCMFGLSLRGIGSGEQTVAQQMLEESCLQMLEGQYLDISYESRMDTTITDYLDMVARKTGALMGCAAAMGALLSLGTGGVMERFRRWGQNLGLAYQMKDDILAIWGDEKDTGKARGNDIRRRKKSLPVVYWLQKAPPEDRADMDVMLRNPLMAEEDVEAILGMLDAQGTRSYCEDLALSYCERAEEEIDGIDLPRPWREEIARVAQYLAARSF